MKQRILRTRLCDMLGIEYPIVLAGMGSRGNDFPINAAYPLFDD